MTRHFVFIGVTTAQSSIMRIFPHWRDLLGLGDDVQLIGWDLPLHTPPQRYRETAIVLRDDPRIVGGLVTTHKISLLRAAHDIFDEIDDYARLLGEVSCFARRSGRLLGWAKDPLTAGRTLQEILGPGYFGRTGGEVLCFGAGGAGQAITLYLASCVSPTDRPARIVVTDLSEERLDEVAELHRQRDSHGRIEYRQTSDPTVNDALLASMPPCSLVINATGTGKDRPGSPITDAARFPRDAVVWELNYRGKLDFLHQARRQASTVGVRVEDGWQYFIYGWTTVFEAVFERPISATDMMALKDAAEFARPFAGVGPER